MKSGKTPFSRRWVRTRFAYKFLQALKKLNKKQRARSCNNNTLTSSYMEAYKRRCRMIKTAADGSMASAVGSRRVWSRALLWKIRSRGLIRRSLAKRTKRAPALMLRKRIITRRKENPGKVGGLSHGTLEEEADELRKLVPGGETMDLLSLFDEAAHYMKCLAAQFDMCFLYEAKGKVWLSFESMVPGRRLTFLFIMNKQSTVLVVVEVYPQLKHKPLPRLALAQRAFPGRVRTKGPLSRYRAVKTKKKYPQLKHA